MKQALGKMFWKIGDKLALGYDAGDSNRMRRDLGWGRRSPSDEDSMVASDDTRQLIRQKSADLRRNNATVAGVCDRLALFTCGHTGILPQAKTSDKGWNTAAEQFWAEWSQRCDSRGRSDLFDFQWQSTSVRPVMGGIYFQKLIDGTIRPVECERIRNPQDRKMVKGWTDGVRVNPKTGQVEAYLVHSRDDNGGFSKKHGEFLIDSANMIPVITPSWRPDQVREIPDLASIIPLLQDIHEMNTYTLNTAKWQSMVLGFLKKNNGMGLNAFPRGSGTATPTIQQRQTFKTNWGEILEGFPNEDLDLKSSNTPNGQHIPYVKLQLALCASALSMPYEFFTLDLAGLDFSRQKGMLLLVNFAIRPWRTWLIRKFLQPLWNWRIAMEMGPGGALKPASKKGGISEWTKVDWQAPEELWIDRQEAMQADVLEIQAGLLTLSKAAKRRGQDYETLLRERVAEEKMIDEIAAEAGMDASRLVKMQIPGQTEKAANPSAPAPDTEDNDEDDTEETGGEDGE